MGKWLCGLPLFLLLSLGGVAVLVWWLWRLWTRDSQQEPAPAIELHPTKGTDQPLPEADLEGDVAPESVLGAAPSDVEIKEPKLDTDLPDVVGQAPSLDIDEPGLDVLDTTVRTPELEVDLQDADVTATKPKAEEPTAALERLEGEVGAIDVEIGESVSAPDETDLEELVDVTPPEPQDLKVVEGIGPKYESVLNKAGILTFAQLAAASVDQLKEILVAENPRYARLADPTTWPEQASLASAGDWDALQALQDQMKAGRRPNIV